MVFSIFKNSKEQELMQRVLEVFLSQGVKNITMDDVANELHISKKTLYKYVKNRKELVTKTTKLQVLIDTESINEIISKRFNAIEENIEITNYSLVNLSKVNSSVHSDLEKYFIDAWKVWVEYQKSFIYSKVLNNLINGIKEGLYLESINPEIIARIYMSKIDMVFNGDIFPAESFKFSDVYISLITQHMRGIATSKGLEELDKLNITKL